MPARPARRPAARAAPAKKKPFALTTNTKFRGPDRINKVNYVEGKNILDFRVKGAPTKVSGTYLLGKRKIKLR
ncbi:MAG: hypothetical protein Q7R70_05755 [Candidatus Diapherotrites archaeon]|nr:hypothetical protein [Candidatus Diapherotrites archaeon]